MIMYMIMNMIMNMTSYDHEGHIRAKALNF
jgi:hypothetical protein